jgi:hypothetical protein
VAVSRLPKQFSPRASSPFRQPLLDEGVVEDPALMESPGRVAPDGVVDRRSDITVGQVEYFTFGAYGHVKRPRHHAGVQLDIRCARGLWFHLATGLKIIAAMLGGRTLSQRYVCRAAGRPGLSTCLMLDTRGLRSNAGTVLAWGPRKVARGIWPSAIRTASGTPEGG